MSEDRFWFSDFFRFMGKWRLVDYEKRWTFKNTIQQQAFIIISIFRFSWACAVPRVSHSLHTTAGKTRFSSIFNRQSFHGVYSKIILPVRKKLGIFSR